MGIEMIALMNSDSFITHIMGILKALKRIIIFNLQ